MNGEQNFLLQIGFYRVVYNRGIFALPPQEDTNLYSSWAKEGVQRALAEKDEQGNIKLVFQDKLEDVEYDRWTDRGNSLAYYLGVVDGRSPGHFDPDAQITRQEAAVMLAKAYRVVGKTLPEVSEDLPFQDAEQIADWAKESVAVMYHWGILQGKEDGSFDPQGSFTREQCLLTLLRLCGGEGWAFSEDGRIFTCTAVLTGDSKADNGSEEGVVVHRAGLYHISVDVETLEATQTWEPLPA